MRVMEMIFQMNPPHPSPLTSLRRKKGRTFVCSVIFSSDKLLYFLHVTNGQWMRYWVVIRGVWMLFYTDNATTDRDNVSYLFLLSVITGFA